MKTILQVPQFPRGCASHYIFLEFEADLEGSVRKQHSCSACKQLLQSCIGAEASLHSVKASAPEVSTLEISENIL